MKLVCKCWLESYILNLLLMKVVNHHFIIYFLPTLPIQSSPRGCKSFNTSDACGGIFQYFLVRLKTAENKTFYNIISRFKRN